jgi:hypothetical protein
MPTTREVDITAVPELFNAGNTITCAAKLNTMIGSARPSPLASHVFDALDFPSPSANRRAASVTKHNPNNPVVANPNPTTFSSLF